MTAVAPFTILSAKNAKARFGKDGARRQPVGITKHDRLTAYVVSKRDFDRMLASIESLEDQLWLAKAELARKEGFVGPDRVDVVLA